MFDKKRIKWQKGMLPIGGVKDGNGPIEFKRIYILK